MSIETKGFLSCKLKRYIRRFRREHSEAFALARGLSETAQRLILSVSFPSSDADADAKALTALFLPRATSTFQGVILLSERGMVVEARTLSRACFENAAALSAAAHLKDAIFQKLIAAAEYKKIKLIQDLLAPAAAQYLDEAQRIELNAKLAELTAKKPAKYSVFDMARDGTIVNLYMLYRRLSADAAHPGIDALERYFDPAVRKGTRTIKWGPAESGGELADTLLGACAFFLAALTAANDVVGTVQLGDEIGAHFEEYKRLLANEEAQDDLRALGATQT